MKNELYHHGVKGMKWGVRHDPVRGSFRGNARRAYSKVFDLNARTYSKMGNHELANRNRKEADRQRQLAYKADIAKASKSSNSKKIKTAAIIGGSVIAAGLAVYGGVQLKGIVDDKHMQLAINKGQDAYKKYYNNILKDVYVASLDYEIKTGDNNWRRSVENSDRKIQKIFLDNYANKSKNSKFTTKVANLAAEEIYKKHRF